MTERSGIDSDRKLVLAVAEYCSEEKASSRKQSLRTFRHRLTGRPTAPFRALSSLGRRSDGYSDEHVNERDREILDATCSLGSPEVVSRLYRKEFHTSKGD